MDLGAWGAFLVQCLVFAVVSGSLAAGVFGAAIAQLGRMPVWVGVLGATLVPVVGLTALLIVALVRRGNAAQSGREVVSSAVPDSAGFAAQAPTRSPTLADVFAPARFEAAAPLPSTLADERPRKLARPRRAPLATLLVITLAAVSTLVVTWFRFDPVVFPSFSFGAWGTGLDVAVIVSVAVLAGAVALAWARPSRWAAVVVVAIGSAWACVGATGLALAGPITALLTDIGAFSYTIGDGLAALGISGTAGVVSLPPGVDVGWLGIENGQLDLSGVDLGAPLPTATLELGPAWFIVLAVGVASIVWSIGELIAAHRGRRR